MSARDLEAYADAIFSGGDIITVDDRSPTAEALAVGAGRSAPRSPFPSEPRRADPDRLDQIRVIATYRDGRRCWSSG